MQQQPTDPVAAAAAARLPGLTLSTSLHRSSAHLLPSCGGCSWSPHGAAQRSGEVQGGALRGSTSRARRALSAGSGRGGSP